MQTSANRSSKLFIALGSFTIIFALLALLGYLVSQRAASGSSGRFPALGLGTGAGSNLALIYIEGPITASAAGGVFAGAGASSDTLCDLLYRAKDDDNIKGVLLRINSPGGSAAASDEIYRAVMALRKAGKPVVVSMGDVAASGGYYISSAADYIYADGATLTGSIGVIFELVNWEELAKKAGVKSTALHAGEFKDIGSPWRDMTDAEKGMMTKLLTQVHNQFIHAVAEGRGKAKIDEDDVRKLATGMVYTGEEAVNVKLVDALGGQHEAEAKLRELTHLDKDAPVEEYGATSFWDQIFSAKSQSPLPGALAAQAARELSDPLMQLAGGLCLNTTLRDLIIR